MAERFEELIVRQLSRKLTEYLGKVFYNEKFRNWSF